MIPGTRPEPGSVGPIWTPCAECPLRANRHFRDFSGPEAAFVQRFKIGEMRLGAGTNILLTGTRSPHLYTLLRGWTFRHATLEDGRRQVLNFGLPGEFLGLQLSLQGELEHTVTALTDVTLCVFDRERTWELFRGHPELSYAMTWMASREALILDGHLLAIGQRPAHERLAYLLVHLYQRAEQVNLAGNDTMETPFTQAQVADALGLTPVHTSRCVKRLELDGLIQWKRPILRLLDREGLRALVGDLRVPPDPRRFI